MARLKCIWGPHKEIVGIYLTSWFFTGIGMDDKIHGWSLRFHYKTRAFSARANNSPTLKRKHEMMSQKDLWSLPEVQRATPSKNDTIANLLRASVPPDQLAAAMARAINDGR